MGRGKESFGLSCGGRDLVLPHVVPHAVLSRDLTHYICTRRWLGPSDVNCQPWAETEDPRCFVVHSALTVSGSTRRVEAIADAVRPSINPDGDTSAAQLPVLTETLHLGCYPDAGPGEDVDAEAARLLTACCVLLRLPFLHTVSVENSVCGTEKMWRGLLEALQLQRLRSFTFSYPSPDRIAAFAEVLDATVADGPLPLRCLEISQCATLREADVDKLCAALARNTELRELTIAGPGTTGAIFRSFGRLGHLRVLEIDYCLELQQNCSLASLPASLRELTLRSTTIDDAGLCTMDTGRMQNLARVALPGSLVTLGGMRHLAQLPALSSLDVRQCRRIVDEDESDEEDAVDAVVKLYEIFGRDVDVDW